MQIGANAVFVAASFGFVFGVVAGADDYFTKWLHIFAKLREAGMVFIADYFAKFSRLDCDIADVTFLSCVRSDIKNINAFDGFAGAGFVVFAE